MDWEGVPCCILPLKNDSYLLEKEIACKLTTKEEVGRRNVHTPHSRVTSTVSDPLDAGPSIPIRPASPIRATQSCDAPDALLTCVKEPVWRCYEPRERSCPKTGGSLPVANRDKRKERNCGFRKLLRVYFPELSLDPRNFQVL